jgi:hypothetical protein
MLETSPLEPLPLPVVSEKEHENLKPRTWNGIRSGYLQDASWSGSKTDIWHSREEEGDGPSCWPLPDYSQGHAITMCNQRRFAARCTVLPPALRNVWTVGHVSGPLAIKRREYSHGPAVMAQPCDALRSGWLALDLLALRFFSSPPRPPPTPVTAWREAN